MVERFLRCEYCGGTYSAEREWCPHCLAPRPEREKMAETRADDTNANVFYSDDVMYLTIDDEPEKKSFAELEAEMNGLNDKIDGMLAEQRGIVTTNETRELLDQCSDVGAVAQIDEIERNIRFDEDGYVTTQTHTSIVDEEMEWFGQLGTYFARVLMVIIVIEIIAYFIMPMLFPTSTQ